MSTVADTLRSFAGGVPDGKPGRPARRPGRGYSIWSAWREVRHERAPTRAASASSVTSAEVSWRCRGWPGAGTISASAALSDGSHDYAGDPRAGHLGDVQGIDTTLITRQYPRPDATDVETEFFPLVEFGAPELPWLLPTPDGAQGPLPWLSWSSCRSETG